MPIYFDSLFYTVKREEPIAGLGLILLRRRCLPSFLILVPAELEKGREAFGPSSLLAFAWGWGRGSWRGGFGFFCFVFALSFSAFGRKLPSFFWAGIFLRILIHIMYSFCYIGLMLKIPVYLIEAFISFCQTRHMESAASLLGVSQPALSKQLMAFEKMLPQPVFTFRGRQKVLTSFGEELFVQLQDRLSGLQELIEQTSLNHADPATSFVRIASRREILDRFADRLPFPGTVQLVESANTGTINGILNRGFDLGIVHQVPNSSELIARPLFKDHFMLVIPKKMLKNPPTKSKELWRELKTLPAICYKKPDEILTQICEAQGVSFASLNVTRFTANYLSVAKLVNAGVGWAAVPTHISTVTNNNHIIPVSLKDFPPRQFYAVFRQETKNAPWLRQLLQELTVCFADQK